MAPQPTNVNRGNDVLGQLFGSKEVSRTVAQDAASKTGLSADLLKKMLPMVAMLVTGYMAKQKTGTAPAGAPAAGGGLGGMLGGLVGGGGTGAARSGATGGIGSMLDMNGDGNALDDILRLAGKGVR